jgi:hypothetical protein
MGGRAVYEVYSWDDYAGRFQVHAAFTHRGAAQVVAGRLTESSGTPHLVRFRAG